MEAISAQRERTLLELESAAFLLSPPAIYM
jgi:hypothetical protein